jgi:pimeloyl-ACP methyl ester carboxylesterase
MAGSPGTSAGASARASGRASAPPRARTLLAADGVPISAAHDAGPPGPSGTRLAVVVAHGFTGSWRKPSVRAVAAALRPYAAVVSLDLRGHGRSGGSSTVGDREVLDVDAAVRWARTLGYARVATLGFSLGGAVVVRHAALYGTPDRSVDAVASVSAPSRWWYRGTRPMRLAHWAFERPHGRAVLRHAYRTRVDGRHWDAQRPDSWCAPPVALAPRIAPVPLLVVHGDRDDYFPLEHAQALHAAAREPKELWVERGFGHAEAAAPAELVERVAGWLTVRTAVAATAASADGARWPR